MLEQDFENVHSPVHRLDPRAKVVVAICFSFVVALSDRFTAVIPSILSALFLVFLAHLPPRKVCSRLLAVNGLILVLWVFLPFTYPGETLFRVGPFQATREGILYTLLITLKTNAIILALIALVTTMSAFDTGRAMRRLGIPTKIVHLFLLTYRYIHVIYMEYQRITKAMKIRGFSPKTDLHTYRTYAYLVGMLFIRSYDRAERVRAAMLCRGFTGKYYDLGEFSFGHSDRILTGLMLL
ncbi:MAG: cobalt ECF transporter T component CbiQ, partial [Deltaproteobacteria bacterium]|nr:cobalt ECF transporter T component CbiQ [Deltaproteobacteria bacterium]